MMDRILRALSICAFATLLGAAPAHLLTGDHFGGYAGTRSVEPNVAARWLTWAETDFAGSRSLRQFGVKTMLYTDPNRVMKGDADFPSDESAFAHDCRGSRVEATNRPGQYLGDPHSTAMLATWKSHVTRYVAEGKYDAVFEDDANTVEYTNGRPCNFDANDWLRATVAMQRSLDFPIIYNGLSNFSDRTVSISIGLNETSIGGLMEECYASAGVSKQSGDRWHVAEATEQRMAQARKLFFCYDNDTSPATGSLDARLYVLASFLLTFDPSTSALWEYYQGPSRFHVMPEVQLVPLQPRVQVRSVDDLRTAAGIYQRAYAQCAIAGRSAGPCVVAVNPDTAAHPLSLGGYRKTFQITGGGIVDGGAIRVSATAPPSELAGLSAVIAFQ